MKKILFTLVGLLALVVVSNTASARCSSCDVYYEPGYIYRYYPGYTDYMYPGYYAYPGYYSYPSYYPGVGFGVTLGF